MSAVRFRLKGSAPPTNKNLRVIDGRTRLYALLLLSAILLPSTTRERGTQLSFCLVARAQPDDGEDQEANHHDGYDEHPNESPEQPREVGRLRACFEQQEHGNEIAHARTDCNGRTLRE